MTEHVPSGPAAAPGGTDEEIQLRPVAAFVAVLVVLVAGTVLGMWEIGKVLKARAVAADPPASPIPEARLPRPRPRGALQADPNGDMARLRASEDAVLGSYAWVDRGAGIARIPIERAMELVAEHGLPTAPEPAPAAPTGGPR